MTTTTDRQRLTDEQLAEIEARAALAFREEPSSLAEEREAQLNSAADVPALLADLKQTRRGAQELGKIVDFLAELIKDAYVRGADDPIDALQMLGNVLAEISEDEDGLSVDEHNRVYRALEGRRAEAERLKAQRDAAERDAVVAAVRRDSEATT